MKRTLALLAVITFLGSSLSLPAFAAVKAGATCPKAGKTSVASGKTFTCIKSGKKLLWNKGVVIAKPTTTSPLLTPSPSPTPSPANSPISELSTASLFSSLEKCKIVDGDPQTTNMTAGFPIPTGRIDLVKGAKVQIIGVDFPDKSLVRPPIDGLLFEIISPTSSI